MPFSCVLDVGAGSGKDLMVAKEINKNALFMGLDYYEPNLDNLRTYGIKCFKINIEYEKIPISDSQVDVIIANQVLEHIKELFWVLHEIFRVLKRGGEIDNRSS